MSQQQRRGARWFRWFMPFARRWRMLQVAEAQLGKYIILFASLLHLAWAALLVGSDQAGGSTPVHILVQVFGGRWRAAVVLVIVSVSAIAFLFVRQRVSALALGFLLVPQQFALLMSATAGIRAAILGHYADGVIRAWPFILCDQMPVILTALLYSVAVLESSAE